MRFIFREGRLMMNVGPFALLDDTDNAVIDQSTLDHIGEFPAGYSSYKEKK